jgi:tetratricopeptide (TPR) repeat protein
VNKTARLVALTALVAAAAPFLPAAEPVALGQAGKKHDAAVVEQARQRMETGQALFSQGRYAQAMAEFEAAYATQPYGAFLYNAAVAAEKAKDLQRAIAHYKEFLASDPNAPDAPEIKAVIDRLEKVLSAPPDADAGAPGDGGAPDGGATDGGAADVAPDAETAARMRSLVLLESDPPGAPLVIYERTFPTAPPWKEGAPGWKKILSGIKTPQDISLNIGHYHVVVEPFQDYHRSETDISLAPGHVYTFKANLSQGAFLGFLKIKSPVEGAKIYVDDPPPHKHAPAGRTPYSGLVESGAHTLWIEAPGYTTYEKKVDVAHGDTVQFVAELEHVDYGYLRIDGNSDEVTIEIDGQKQEPFKNVTGPVRIKVPAGKHKVVLDASGRKKFRGEIEVPRGQEVGVHATLIDLYPRGKAIGFGVLSAGAIAGGIVTLPETKIVINKDDPNVDKSRVDLFRGVSTGLFIGAGVFTAASLFFSFYDPDPNSLVKLDKAMDLKDEDEKKAALAPRVKAIAPMIGQSTGGLMVGGTF